MNNNNNFIILKIFNLKILRMLVCKLILFTEFLLYIFFFKKKMIKEEVNKRKNVK